MKHLPRLTIFWAIKQISINLKVFKSYKVCFLRCQVAQSCPAVCDSMDYSPPGSSVHEILQAKILEWGAMPSSRGSSHPGIKPAFPKSPVLPSRFFITSATWKGPVLWPHGIKFEINKEKAIWEIWVFINYWICFKIIHESKKINAKNEIKVNENEHILKCVGEK